MNTQSEQIVTHLHSLNVEALPKGIVCSPISILKPGTIAVDAVLEARKGLKADARVQE